MKTKLFFNRIPFSLSQDQASPKTIEYNNAISFNKNSSKSGNTTASDAGAVLSQVATNDIPSFYNDDKEFNDELPSFNPDAQRITMACPPQKGSNPGLLGEKQPAKNSLSFTRSCGVSSQFMYSSRSGWGVPLIGLKGGAGGDTSVANGTSGWGPPPSGGAGSASASGWGAPPPPNPVASAAWGAPGPGMSPGQGNKTQSGKI